VRTLLPASEEAYESGLEECTSTLQQAVQQRSALTSRLAARVLAAHLFHRAIDLDSQPDDAGSMEEGVYWTQYQSIDNDLAALLIRLPEGLRLPRNFGCQQAVLVNVLIHAATMCLHKTATRKARDDKCPDANFALMSGRSRMLAAAAQILAIVRLVNDTPMALVNPIEDYVVYLAALVFLEDFALGGSLQSKGNLVFLLDTLRAVGQCYLVPRTLADQLQLDLERLGMQADQTSSDTPEVSSQEPD
jgi:hypothetical protein